MEIQAITHNVVIKLQAVLKELKSPEMIVVHCLIWKIPEVTYLLYVSKCVVREDCGYLNKMFTYVKLLIDHG